MAVKTTPKSKVVFSKEFIPVRYLEIDYKSVILHNGMRYYPKRNDVDPGVVFRVQLTTWSYKENENE